MNKTIYIIYTIILVLILALSLALNILYKKKVDKLPSNSLLFKNKKIVIFSLLATICISAIGAIYCLTALLFPSNSVTTITRPPLGSDDANLSLITDSELYTGTIDIDVPSKELEFTEALEIFSKYREELNTYVLGDNTSFLEIRSPLFFPASIGEENIRYPGIYKIQILLIIQVLLFGKIYLLTAAKLRLLRLFLSVVIKLRYVTP